MTRKVITWKCVSMTVANRCNIHESKYMTNVRDNVGMKRYVFRCILTEDGVLSSDSSGEKLLRETKEVLRSHSKFQG